MTLRWKACPLLAALRIFAHTFIGCAGFLCLVIKKCDLIGCYTQQQTSACVFDHVRDDVCRLIEGCSPRADPDHSLDPCQSRDCGQTKASLAAKDDENEAKDRRKER